MLKKVISIATALSLCAAAATTVSAELNYTNARPYDTQTVDFSKSEIGAVTTSSLITVRYANDGAERTNQYNYSKIAESLRL